VRTALASPGVDWRRASACCRTALTPFFTSSFGLVVTIGILTAVGSGAGSFSVMIGALAQRLAPKERATASGLITGGGSFGQFLFAPITQTLISTWGWMGAMWSLGAISLLALPLVKPVIGPARHSGALGDASRDGGMKATLRKAFGNSSYLLLHGSFLTCGFHIAFLVTHLPGEVDLCGLPASVASWSLGIIGLSNIAGSFAAGGCSITSRQVYSIRHVWLAHLVDFALSRRT